MGAIVISHVIRLGCIVEEPLTLVDIDADDERPRLGGRVRRQAGHETAARFQDRRAVVLGAGFDAGQRQPNRFHYVEHAGGIIMRSATSATWPRPGGLSERERSCVHDSSSPARYSFSCSSSWVSGNGRSSGRLMRR